MKKHSHRFEQRLESNRPGCTVKVFECPCGAWNIRHFGCFNQGHDQDTLATLTAAQKDLKEYQRSEASLGDAYATCINERAEAQGALKESSEFWEDNMDGLLETALKVGATAVVENIDGFYSTPDGELRLDRIREGK